MYNRNRFTRDTLLYATGCWSTVGLLIYVNPDVFCSHLHCREFASCKNLLLVTYPASTSLLKSEGLHRRSPTDETNYIASKQNCKERQHIINGTLKARVAPNLTFSNSAEAEFGRISELKFGRSRSRSRSRSWLKLVFWSQNNTPVIKLMASTMVSAAIEAVHISASFVALLFVSYW